MKTCVWGEIQQESVIADGISFVSTPSHGGFVISERRRQEMPDKYKSFIPWAGERSYEEDCDWVIVVSSFPDCFSAEEIDIAHKMIANDPGYYNGRGMKE